MVIEKEGMFAQSVKEIIEKDGCITCACGNPKLKLIMHCDGDEYFSNTYECECGNVISITQKREEKWF